MLRTNSVLSRLPYVTIFYSVRVSGCLPVSLGIIYREAHTILNGGLCIEMVLTG